MHRPRLTTEAEEEWSPPTEGTPGLTLGFTWHSIAGLSTANFPQTER